MKVLLYCTDSKPYLVPKFSIDNSFKLSTQLFDTPECKKVSLNGTVCGECQIESIEQVVPFFCSDVEKFEREKVV